MCYLHETDFNIGESNYPSSFNEVVSCSDSGSRIAAMQKELNSMQNNDIRDPIDLPNNLRKFVVNGS